MGEQWYSILVMLWGVVLFGYVLGGLASILTNNDAQRARFIHRLNIIKDYLVSSSCTELAAYILLHIYSKKLVSVRD